MENMIEMAIQVSVQVHIHVKVHDQVNVFFQIKAYFQGHEKWPDIIEEIWIYDISIWAGLMTTF